MEGAAKLYLDKDLKIRVLFGSGITKSFDMGTLIDRRPELIALKDRKLFEKGKLSTSYGISWNDDIDIAIEYIYDHGTIVENEENYLQYGCIDQSCCLQTYFSIKIKFDYLFLY